MVESHNYKKNEKLPFLSIVNMHRENTDKNIYIQDEGNQVTVNILNFVKTENRM